MVCAYASPSISSNHPNFRESQDTNSFDLQSSMLLRFLHWSRLATCANGVVSLQKIEPFFTPGSCRSWRDQRRPQINGGQGNWCGLNLYTGANWQKKMVCPEQKQKTHVPEAVLVSFHGKMMENGTTSLFLGGEDGIYQSERFSSCDRFPRRWKRLWSWLLKRALLWNALCPRCLGQFLSGG